MRKDERPIPLPAPDPSPVAGSVAALWRYPVKSMQGEALTAATLDARGLLGDRAYAVLERATGHIASAKHPRKWRRLFACRAAYAAPPRPDAPLPPVIITPPDGPVIRSDQADCDQALSRLLGCAVALITLAPPAPTREADRTPDDHSGGTATIRQEPLALAAPAGTFFDYAPLHLLTTATLAALGQIYPAGQFDPRRFRPNLLITPAEDASGFVEQAWLGYRLILGATVHLQLIDPCPRCVVTTLAQGELPHDPQILRTLSAHTTGVSRTLAPGAVFPAVAGIYGRALQGGPVRIGDAVRLGEQEATPH